MSEIAHFPFWHTVCSRCPGYPRRPWTTYKLLQLLISPPFWKIAWSFNAKYRHQYELKEYS